MSGQQIKQKSAIERLEDLERAISSMGASGNVEQALNSLQQAIGQLSQNVNKMSMALDSTVAVLIEKGLLTGADITKKSQELEVDRRLKAEEMLLARGLYTEGVDAGEDSLVAVKESNKATGEVILPRELVRVGALDQEIKELFIGKKSGDSVEKDGNVYEILRVLELAQSREVTEQA